MSVLLLLLFATIPDVMDADALTWLITDKELRSIADVPWLILRLGLESTTGLLTVFAVVMLLLRRETEAIGVAIFAVILSLTTVVLLTFYLDQFGAIYTAALQFVSLVILWTYRRWYLDDPAS